MSVDRNYWNDRVVLVTGASEGLGRHVALRLAGLGARVTALARRADALAELADAAGPQSPPVATASCDVTKSAEVAEAVQQVRARHGRIDGVFHCVGRSMRGRVLETSPEVFRELWEVNFLSAVLMAQATVPDLMARQGHFVAVGSLASRVAARYLGAYPSAKAALALFMHQLRLEHARQGLHAMLVLSGPIARADAGQRYTGQSQGLPESASRPGGGAKVAAIQPDKLVDQMLVGCQRRDPELVVPRSARILFAMLSFFPNWADSVVLHKTEGD
ncbi:MAG: SDR family NAD(P)-dependent oxidoreductase [Pirellulales bacterium]